ncbi:hypothetical protein [Actinomadura rubrisoli]|uniref:hypothetical protein n=1 Tax=Actinomadura rubrisoli TaxID=2530368 RepID=UPI001404C766|nr:hypothetical protein [Actinomadura rubrisoli]
MSVVIRAAERTAAQATAQAVVHQDAVHHPVGVGGAPNPPLFELVSRRPRRSARYR